jgi:hypothetical protein
MKVSPGSLALVFGALVAASGCTDPRNVASEEACEHAQEGPFNAVTASTVADASAPNISEEHTSHDVTLVAVTDGNGGFVQLDSEGGPHIFFLTKVVPLSLADGNGGAIAGTSVAESTCPEVVTAVEAELPVGKIFVELGPTTEESVSVVVEPAPHEDDESHDDDDD